MKKKILIFSLVYFPRNVGGAEIAVKEITDRLGDGFSAGTAPVSGWDFDMIVMDKDGKDFERVGNVNVYTVGLKFLGKSKFLGKTYKYFYIFLAFFKALKLHRKNNYDAIWSIMANYAGFSAMFFKSFHKEIPLILTLQEGDPIDYIRKRVGIFYPWFVMIFKRANIIQTISNYLAEWAKEEGAKCPIVVVPNGVNLERFTSEKYKTESVKIREDFGFLEDDIILVTASRLVEKNAVEDIISALKYLPENVKLLIIGTGALEGDLKSQAENYKLQNRIVFAGYKNHKDLPAFLSASDIFIRPSLSEGFGNSFIEAMACKLPVIATPVGGIIDFLKDGETGLICEVKNPKSIAQKVDKLINDKESRDFIIENSYKMVVEKYDWNLIAKNMREKIFNTLTINGK